MTDFQSQHETEHTPTPWRFGNTGSDIIMILGGPSSAYVCTVQIEQCGGGFIARAMEPERRANAAFIVEAVNNHARLTARVEELEKALAFYADPHRYDGPNLRPIANDPFQPDGLVYRLDVTRDLGSIARRALTPRSSVEGK